MGRRKGVGRVLPVSECIRAQWPLFLEFYGEGGLAHGNGALSVAPSSLVHADCVHQNGFVKCPDNFAPL